MKTLADISSEMTATKSDNGDGTSRITATHVSGEYKEMLRVSNGHADRLHVIIWNAVIARIADQVEAAQ